MSKEQPCWKKSQISNLSIFLSFFNFCRSIVLLSFPLLRKGGGEGTEGGGEGYPVSKWIVSTWATSLLVLSPSLHQSKHPVRQSTKNVFNYCRNIFPFYGSLGPRLGLGLGLGLRLRLRLGLRVGVRIGLGLVFISSPQFYVSKWTNPLLLPICSLDWASWFRQCSYSPFFHCQTVLYMSGLVSSKFGH